MANWQQILNKRVYDYTVFVDGSAPIQGLTWGYGAVILTKDSKKEIQGGGDLGTNNIAELTAAIKGLEQTEEDSTVLVISDSQYVVNAFNLKWIDTWRKKGWNRPKGILKNKELWQELYSLTTKREVVFSWVKGHDGVEFNERADELAGEYVRKLNEDRNPN